MRSPRKVTAQPMGMPLRILKFAMDFLARVIIAFWPVIWPSSCAAVSSSFTFWLASPRPMFTVIFCNLGTAMRFFQPKRFISAATVSLRYFSCNRLFIAFLRLVLYELLVQCRLAMPATAHLRAVRQNRVADPRVLAATRANDHHVGNIDGRFLFHDPALDVLRRVGTRVALDDADVLDDHRVFREVNEKHAAGLSGVLASQHFDLVALANLNPQPLGPCVFQCHELPNLRSQRNDLGEFLLAQFARHRAKHARADGLAGIVDEHRGIVVKPDVRAVLAPALFAHAHHHGFHHTSLFDLAFRRSFFHRGGDDIAEAGLQPRVAAHRHDAGQLARAGIVRHRQPGSHLNHWSVPLSLLLGRRVPRQHFFQPPALQLGKRPRSYDTDRVAGLGLAIFVVRVELFRDAHDPAVLGMLHQPLHLDYDGFLHLRAGYFAGENSSLAALGHRGALCFGCHYAFPAFSSCARTSVFTRARSF